MFVSVFFNDSPTKEWNPKKGLHHRDSLTSFLFLVVGMVRQAVKCKYMIEVKVGKKEVHIKLLQFANDMIIMYEEETQYSNFEDLMKMLWNNIWIKK